MSIRAGSVLLLLLCACAATELRPSTPKQYRQAVVPWVEPLIEPMPLAPGTPVPVGLSPPVTVMVDPSGPVQHEPEASPSPERPGTNRRDPPAPVTMGRRRPECEPIPVPHAGGDEAHNRCADRFPPNYSPGRDVLVGGKRFDALQVGARVLWEIKTDQFDTYSRYLRDQVITDQVEELRRESAIAAACGYGFVVGVSSAAHKDALEAAEPTLTIVVTECER